MSISDILTADKFVKVSAPMVRYSKLAFRTLVRHYGCDIAYTPMVVADAFVKSQKARDSEFTTTKYDRFLVTQFAANNAIDFANAAEIVYPYCQAIDLNCGCPQKWAMADGYGASLLIRPEIIKDIILQTYNRIPGAGIDVTIKIRLLDSDRATVNLCQMAEACGATWITVHARTKEQRADPPNMEAVRTVVNSVRIPVVANGDITSLEQAEQIVAQTGVKGVMSAQGLLNNPTMFNSGQVRASISDCVALYIAIAAALGTKFTTVQRHVVQMSSDYLTRSEMRLLCSLLSIPALCSFVKEFIGAEVTDYHRELAQRLCA